MSYQNDTEETIMAMNDYDIPTGDEISQYFEGTVSTHSATISDDPDINKNEISILVGINPTFTDMYT